MDTDFEQRLGDMLRATTPEPPAAYRFVPPSEPAQPSPADELHLVRDPDVAVWHRRRWAPLLAAAAVVLLGTGLAAGALLQRTDHTSPAVTTPTASRGTSTVGVPCRNRDLLLGQSGAHRTATGLSTVITVANTGRTECTLTPLPVLSVRPGTTGADPSTPSTVLPTAGARPLQRLAPGTALAYTVQLVVARSCPAAERGPSAMQIGLGDGFSYDLPLTGADCPVAPRGVTVARVRSR